MRNVSLSAAFIFVIALAGLTPAKAEMNGPIHDEQGQCKQQAANNHNGNFFYMAPCPKPAADKTNAVPANTTIVAHRRHHRG